MNTKHILRDIAKRNSVDSIANVIPGKVLEVPQQVAVVYSLLQRKLLISMDTGLGKTVVACALMNLLLDKEDKALFILKRGTLEELYSKIKKDLRPDLSYGYLTSENKVIAKMIDRQIATVCNVLVVSSDCIYDNDVNDFLYKYISEIKVVIIDEMHMFSNLESVESRLMKLIVKKTPYTFALTATPFERDISQLINTVSMLQPHLFADKSPRYVYNKFTTRTKDGRVTYHDLDKLKKICSPAVFNITRSMLDIEVVKNCSLHLIRPLPEWTKLTGTKATITFKGDISQQPFFKLCELITQYKMLGKRGLVYANLNDVKKPILDKLNEVGYKVGIIDGSISTDKDIKRYKYLFKKSELDCIITNTVTSLDLECDYIIFYEMTLSYIQMLGRINRSREDKECFIDFIIVKDTVEERFFEENVYKRVQLLNTMYDKGGEELKPILKKLGAT